jgi:hypothetical protein
MSSLYNQLIAILSPYMSTTNAHSVLGRTARQADVNPELLEPRDIEVIAPTLKTLEGAFASSSRSRFEGGRGR